MAWLNREGNAHHLRPSSEQQTTSPQPLETACRIKEHMNIFFFLNKCCILLDWGASGFCGPFVVHQAWQRLALMHVRSACPLLGGAICWSGRVSPTVGAGTRQVWGLGGCCCFASTLLRMGRRIFAVFSSLRHTAWVITTPDSESYHKRIRRGSPVTLHFEKWEELEFGGQIAPPQPIWWPCNNKSLRLQI